MMLSCVVGPGLSSTHTFDSSGLCRSAGFDVNAASDGILPLKEEEKAAPKTFLGGKDALTLALTIFGQSLV